MTAQEHSTFSQHLIILCIVKNFSLSKEVWYVSYVSGQCFVAYLIGVSVRNKFYIRTEEGESHISQYEGQLHDQDQAWGSAFEPPTSAFKKPDVAPCSRNTSTGEAEQTAPGSVLASQSNYTTVVSNALWPYLQEIRWRSWKNTPPLQRTWVYFPGPSTPVPKASAPSSDILGPCTDVVHLQTSRWNAHTHKQNRNKGR